MSELEPEPLETGVGWTFWLLGLGLVLYVALCSGHRDRQPEADAWEHHRVVAALTRDLKHPGNPTYATPEPSIRYSPYMIVLASICRSTGVDPYNALTGAAVCNTALLIVGLRLLLGRFGEARIGTAALITMISLWGVAPGYANSYALVDLPWHQVNPSAFSFAISLIIWSIFTAPKVGKSRWLMTGVCILLGVVAVLDHPMTGVFGLLGLFIFAAADPARRLVQLARAMAVTAAVGSLCLAWPWYSFRAALTWKGDKDYWFNPYILHLAVTQWCAPGIAALLVALPLRSRPLVRACLVGVGVVAGFTLVAAVIRSPTFARLLLPGMVFVHLAIAAFVHESRLLSPRTWPERVRRLFDMRSSAQSSAVAQCLLAAGLVYFLVPQVAAIPRQPHLGRPWVNLLRGRGDANPSPRPELRRVLSPVGPGETVLSDPVTSWQVPSTCPGRVVAALHYELFVPDQRQRMADLEQFFATPDPASRREILKKYGVRWILINIRATSDPANRLIRDAAVVRQEGPYVLMDANRWLADAGDHPL